MRILKLTFFLVFISQICLLAQAPNDDRILLQGFHWESHEAAANGWYNHIKSQANELGDAGFDMVWLPPPSNAGSDEGYLPRELNNMSNNYGNAADHASMINELHNNGIEAIADIVINHRIGCTNWMDFCNPTWGSWSITGDDEVWSQSEYSDIYPRGNNDTGTHYGPARDIDHTNQDVQQGISTWMNDVLKGIGYDGWRYDFVHGFDPYYIGLYNGNSNPSFSVGEYWTQDKQAIQNWIDATGSTAFDFPTYFALKGAIRDGNWSYLSFQGEASGGIGWDPQHYTTFIENHDTPDYDPNNNVLNGGNVGSAYAYLLTHPGVPTVFYSHYADWGSSVKQEIKDLMAVRKSAGIHSQSGLVVHASSSGLYAASIQGNNGKVAVKLGFDNWSPSDAGLSGNWTLAASGNNYAVWTEGGPPPPGENIKVYVLKSTGYTTAYAWDDNENPLLGAWPGTGLTPGTCWNTIEFSSPSSCANIILSDSQGGQTDDLNVCDGQYYYNGGFHNAPPASDPCDPEPPTGNFTVYVQGYSTIYAWDDNQNPLLGAWPGSGLVDEGNGWYSITISGSCANIIFSNNGTGQTDDLYSCGGYYSNGAWSCNDPSTQSSATMYVQGYSTAYAWDDNQNPLLGEWPGTALTDEGNGWFSATVAVACANIIFSNNGTGQTDDLYSCGGTYGNGNWTCDVPEISSRINTLDKTTSTKINVFPTILTRGYFNLTIDAETNVTSHIDVFNLQGQKIKGEQLQSFAGMNSHEINVPSDLNTGMYLVRIRMGNEVFTKKIMVRN